MLSAICHAAIATRNRPTLSMRNRPVSSRPERIVPAKIHGWRVRVISLSHPNAMFERLAAIAPTKAA